jgi:protein-tyrosine phosphatase
MQTLANDSQAVVYLHCRAGHGRTGMVAAIFIGLAFPTLEV